MNAAAFSLAHIAAIQRQSLDDDTVVPVAALAAQPIRPELLHRIVSIPSEGPRSASMLRRRMMSDTLSGLASMGDSLVYVAAGRAGEAYCFYGTSGGQAGFENLSTVLSANHPGVVLAAKPFAEAVPPGLSSAGLLVGSPAPALPREAGEPGPIDRFILGMRESKDMSGAWMLAIVADRLSWPQVAKRLAAVLNELRAVADQDRGQQPIAAHYKMLLQALAEKISRGRATSMWSVSATIAAESPERLMRALGLARSIFAGSASRLDPIRTPILAGVPPIPCRFAAPAPADTAAAFYPGAYASLLDGEELATFTALPRLERARFEVRLAPRFKQAASMPADPVVLGRVLERGQPSGGDYAVGMARLTAHALVAGASGGGKTNTVFHVLRQVASRAVPFLVIEPTKTEYRALLDDPQIGPTLSVFTLGDETVSPLRINPFEVPAGVGVQTHLDRLKAIFNASFTMYAPMPQVLERCLTEIYEDCGFNLATGRNTRGYGPRAMPSLGQLQAKIESVVPSLGYDQRIADDVSAALRTRVDSLRIGAKGLMLDTRVALDMEKLLASPTVIELDAIGDDDEKAFLVGLLFSRIAAEMSRRGPSAGAIRHLTVIEEAHRLFTDVPLVAGSEVGNPKGKAVETFCNILSEIRAYGAGIMIVDQVPTRLARDVIKNTSTKVMHRLPAQDDRETMGRAMVQKEEEIAAGAALPVGVALVHSSGEGGSFEVQVPRAALLAEAVARADADARVRERATAAPDALEPSMRQVQSLMRGGDLSDETFRLLQSLAVAPGPSADVLMPLIRAVARHRPATHGERPVVTLRAMLGVALDTVATGAKWPFALHDRVEHALLAVFDAIVVDLPTLDTTSDLGEPGRRAWREAATVDIYPFPQCNLVCSDFVCLYRRTAQRLAERDPLRTAFASGLAQAGGESLWPVLADVVERAVKRGLSRSVTASERISFAGCFILNSADFARELELDLRDKLFRNVFAEVKIRVSNEDRSA